MTPRVAASITARQRRAAEGRAYAIAWRERMRPVFDAMFEVAA